MSGRFGSVLTAMVTPFDSGGRVDLDAAAALARWLVDHGNEGLVVAGTTGEGSTLTDDEKCDLWRAVAEAVTVPVVAGTGSNDTAHSVELTRRAATTGVAAALVVTPYYSRPSQAGIEGHFRAVAAASDLPVVIYDIPVRTGRKVSHDILLRLAREVPAVVGVKDAANDLGSSARLVAEAPSGFELYSGNDDVTLPLLAIGAVGTIGVATHWTGMLHGEMISAFTKGDVDEARALHARMLPSFAFESSDLAPNPIPTKVVMRLLGQPVGGCRAPMDVEPASLDGEARVLLADLGMTLAAARG